MEKYYTARQAARVLGLKYHTFLLHVRKGIYTVDDRVGDFAMLFLKEKIDERAEEKCS